jgi:hypothetical protein
MDARTHEALDVGALGIATSPPSYPASWATIQVGPRRALAA